MSDARILRERKRVVNYNEDTEQPGGQRKIIQLGGDRRSTRSTKPLGEIGKENQKKRGRPASRSRLLSVADVSSEDSEDGGPSRPPAKRTKSPVREADGEVSDNDANVFVRFARPGKHPAGRQPAVKLQARPSRATVTRRIGVGSDDSAAEDKEDLDTKKTATGGRCGGRPTRTAAAIAKDRLRRDAVAATAGAKGRGSDSLEEEVEVAEDDSGSESDDEADDGDEEVEEAEAVLHRKPLASNRAALKPGRPTRKCVVRTAATAASKGGRRREASPKSQDSAGSDSDDEEEEEEAKVVTRRGSAGRGAGRRTAVQAEASSDGDDDAEEEDGEEEEAEDRQASRGSGDSDDSDAKILDDDGSAGADEEEDETLPRRGPGRPRKDGAAASKAAAAMAKGGNSKASTEAIEKILGYDAAKKKYHVKLDGVSYRRTIYVSQAHLESTKPALLRNFARNSEPAVEIDPDWLKIDRVIACRTVTRGRQGPARQLLVKWRGLEYSDSTWEYEGELSGKEDKVPISHFERFNAPTAAQSTGAGGSEQALRQKDFELPQFCNGRSLRDYQQVSVRWMVNNYSQRRNCILGDEMGLGKTAQSISTLEVLRVVGGVAGPFLVVAPLSTLGHWQREIQTWTDMNVVLLAGAATDRAMIVEHEFYRPASSGATGGRSKASQGRETKFNILLVSYDTLLKERALLRSIPWSAAVFDEAHRLKGLHSSTRAAVEDMDIDWLLLLTGTPIQNNMLELYSILSLLDPDAYPSPEDFTARFGGVSSSLPPTVEQIRALQAALAPVLLRRMKEDVEELPQKEEVVVWVELTGPQRAYYRALYEGQIGALMGGASAKNLPGMRNLAMELRKLCCHPVLCDGLEEDLKLKLAAQRTLAAPGALPEFSCPELELLVRGSGKMVLLHKLLHKLRAEGRRVLIFSQFVIMLNVLEDYCTAVGFPVERIDGTVKGRDRQQAIDRFCAEGEGSDRAFVFLLSTRAGGQGITLTAADTCIIYDSDWNPQNDLQAMARCHRIGQKKEVTVYRLISRDTYEMALFNSASRKYGLDEAILGFSAAASTDPEADAARIAELLRHGAHGLLADAEAGAKQGEAFAAEDINQILAARTEKRQIGSRAGNTFSVATFAVDDGAPAGGGGPPGGRTRGGRRKRGGGRGGGGGDGGEDEDSDPSDADYWRNLMPDAVAAHEARAAEGPVVLGPRKRKQVNYNLDDKKYNPKLVSGSDSDSDSDGDGSGEGGGGSGGAEGEVGGDEGGGAGGVKRRRRRASTQPRGGSVEAGREAQDGQEGGAPKIRANRTRGDWTKAALKQLEDRLVALGPDRWGEVYEQLRQSVKHSAEEVEAAARAMWRLYGVASELAAERRKAEAEKLASALLSIDSDVEDMLLGSAPPAAAAAAGTAAAGAAAGAGCGAGMCAGPSAGPSAAAPPSAAKASAVDEFEERLTKRIPDMVPEQLHAALAGPTSARRLLREAAENLRHGKTMQDLHKLMRHANTQQQQAGGASSSPSGGASGGVNGLRAAYMPPPGGGLLSWWSRTDDEALLLAAAEVGYAPGKPGRTVEHAMRSKHLSGRMVLKPPSQQEAEQQPKEGAGAATAQAVAAGPAKDVNGDQPMAEAAGEGQQQAAAPVAPPPPAPRVPGPNAPLQLSLDEWRAVVSALGRRLSKLISASLDFNRKLSAANAGRQPLAVAKPSRPSGPLPAPSSGGAAAAAPAPRPAAAASATATALAAVPPATLASVVKLVVAAAASAKATLGNTAPRLGGAPSIVTVPQQPQNEQPGKTSPGAAAAQGQQHHQHDHKKHQEHQQQKPPQYQSQAQPQQPRAAAAAATDPHRRTSGDPGQLQHDRPAAGTGTGTAAAAAGGNKAGSLKQSTLPFARVGSSGSNKATTGAADVGGAKKQPRPEAAGAATAPAVAAKAPAAAPAPGRVGPGPAEEPIEIGESD